MENITVEQLIAWATKIILQPAQTIEDISKLTKIRYFLSIWYKKLYTQWSSKEGLYNGERANQSVELQENMPVGKAENQAKAIAEVNNWDYRAILAEAQGINKILDTISGFIIGWQVENKSLNETKF